MKRGSDYEKGLSTDWVETDPDCTGLIQARSGLGWQNLIWAGSC